MSDKYAENGKSFCFQIGVHINHCCIHHGCKYGDSDCPVVLKSHPQAGPCEHCGLSLEGFYGEEDRKIAAERWPDDRRSKDKSNENRAKGIEKPFEEVGKGLPKEMNVDEFFHNVPADPELTRIANEIVEHEAKWKPHPSLNCPCLADAKPPMTKEDIDSALDAYNALSQEERNQLDIDQPVIALVKLILNDAINLKATAIQLYPTPEEITTKYMINGKLEKQIGPPRRLYSALVKRIKLVAGMLLSEKKVSQDGVIETMIKGVNYSVRVKTLPVQGQEAEGIIISNIVPKPELKFDDAKPPMTKEEFRKICVVPVPETKFVAKDGMKFVAKDGESSTAANRGGDRFPLPETETYLHHGGYVAVQKHLKGKHRQHCLCMQGCLKFKPGTEEHCKKAAVIYAVCRAFNMTTPVWECPDYDIEEYRMD